MIIKTNYTTGIPANESQSIEAIEDLSKGDRVTTYLNKAEALRTIFNYDTISSDFYLSRGVKDTGSEILLSEGLIIRQWKNIENISARLIEFNETSVILECLVDKEDLLYEEREFKRSIFNQFELKLGKLFKLCMYERPGQIMMEVKDNPSLVSENDFPQIDFSKHFKKFKIKNPS